MTGTDRAAVVAQLTDEFGARFTAPLASIVGPSIMWSELPDLIAQAAQRLALYLDGQIDADDDGEQVHTAVAVVTALWGDRDPDDAWWRTPVGRRCARALAHDSADAVTYQRAADILGVTRGTVSRLVARGTLDRHPDGGVLLASVYGRLAR